MSRLPTIRFVKLYFRDENKVMRAIPHLRGMLVDDVLAKVYTFHTGDTIWEVEE